MPIAFKKRLIAWPEPNRLQHLLDCSSMTTRGEGGLEQPTRHPLDWKNPDFYDEDILNQELERVFDICHGCRKCVSLCNAFPTLFDLVDASSTMEVDGVAKEDYAKVVKDCYLCDLCFVTKCPYIPPHHWNVDFPHLMLRAKAVAFKQGRTKWNERLLTSTDKVGQIANIPVVRELANQAIGTGFVRDGLGIHRKANVPGYRKDKLKKWRKSTNGDADSDSKVVLFSTCYNRLDSSCNEDLLLVLEHNDVAIALMKQEHCCGMPKLELGDLESVDKLRKKNVPQLLKWIDQGFDIISTIPSCVLMFKQELPLMFPNDKDVKHIARHIFDPSEYLTRLHEKGKLKLDFKHSLGKVMYHAACHTRVQKLGPKFNKLLKLIKGTEVSVIERCSGHDGTYAVRAESYDVAVDICRPVARTLDQRQYDYFASDCTLAGNHIASHASKDTKSFHPMSLIKLAYGL